MENKRPMLLPGDVVRHVSLAFGLTEDQLRSPRRTTYFMRARKAAGFLLRRRCGLSHSDVAAVLNRVNHTSAIYWERSCEEEMQRDPSWRATIEEVTQRIEGEQQR